MPLLEVTLTLANTAYALTDTTTLASFVIIQQWRSNTAAIYFSDADGVAPSAVTATGIEFVAPVAGQTLAGISIGSDVNIVNLATLKVISGTAGQKLEVFYRRL